MDKLLVATKLVKRFGGVTAIDGVDLAMTAGEVRGLIGPNGAGKSTLVDLLTGRRRPDEGSVTFDGSEITGQRPAAIRRSGIGRSFQKLALFPAMSVREQLDLASGGLSNAQESMQLLGLDDVADRPATTLSYGHQRLLDIGLAIASRPSLLVLDEPAAGLSSEESLRLSERLLTLTASTDTALLLVEHDLDLVFAVCTHLTVLHLGQVICDGPSLQVRDDEQVRAVYLGEEIGDLADVPHE